MIYDYTITTGKGETLNLADYKGKVIMVINTATGCGFTPQYAPIEQMYKDYHDQGLEILDIPCNQFGGQAPGSDDEIHEFCTIHFNTTFPQMKKSDVNGPNELPLYTYLKSQKGFEGFGEHQFKALLEKMFAEADPDWDKKPDIKWNFTKFIIDREGNVVARFEPTADMAEVEAWDRNRGTVLLSVFAGQKDRPPVSVPLFPPVFPCFRPITDSTFHRWRMQVP